MQTKASAFAATLIESSWLTALAVVPIFFNTLSYRVFEEDKIPLLRSIAGVVFAALILRSVDEGRGAWTVNGRPLWRVPLVTPMLLLTAAWGVSTVFSIAPGSSWWGAFQRCQGLYTWLSYVTLFGAIVLLLRRPQQRERIVTVALLASLAASAYAVIQHLGRDPIAWGAEVTSRVFGTAGNPIFLGAFLIMVVPLTLVRIVDALRAVSAARAGGSGWVSGAAVAAAAHVCLLVLQLLALMFTQSRGPLVALGSGLIFFFVLFSLHRRLRWLRLTIAAAAVGGTLFLLVFNLPNTPLSPLRQVKYIGRLGRVFAMDGGSAQVRVLIWQGAADLLSTASPRTLVGYGPDTLLLAYRYFYPAQLAHYESRRVAPDRAHNETFDALIMLGLLGCLAELGLFLAFFHHVLRWLGLIRTARQRTAFVGAVALGGVAGGLVPYLVDGSVRFSGVGLPLAMVAGMMLYLLGFADSPAPDGERAPSTNGVLLIGLFAAVMAHFVEIQFGIAIGATRLYFWVYAALAVAAGMPLIQTEPPPRASAQAAPADTDRPDPAPVTGDTLALSAVIGLMLAVLTYSFYTLSFRLGSEGVTCLVIACSLWLFGIIVIAAQPAVQGGTQTSWVAWIAPYSSTTLGVWLLFTALYVPWINWALDAPKEALPVVASHIANAVVLVYVAVFAGITVVAINLRRDEPAPPAGRFWKVALYALPLLGGVAVLAIQNVSLSRANSFAKQGRFYEKRAQWDAAVFAHQEALRLQPGEDRYALNLGGALMEKARSIAHSDRPQRDEYFTRSEAILRRARDISPLNPDHPRNLARLYRLRAALADDPAEVSRYAADALSYYEETLKRTPHSAAVWNEIATLHIEHHEIDKALAALDQSLKVDDHYTTTYWLQGNAYMEMKQFEPALAAYDHALETNRYSMAAWSGRALALVRLNRVPESIDANLRAIGLSPYDMVSHRNLALLYRQTGELDQAIVEAKAALRLAKPEEKPGLESFIKMIEREQAN